MLRGVDLIGRLKMQERSSVLADELARGFFVVGMKCGWEEKVATWGRHSTVGMCWAV